MLDSSRVDFLDSIESELSNEPRSQGSQPSLRSRGRGKAVAATLLATASLMGLMANAASAETGVDSTADASSCNITLQPIARTQSFLCNASNWVYNYQYNYSPNGGIVRCYVFDLTIYNGPCGGTTRVGKKEACQRVALAG